MAPLQRVLPAALAALVCCFIACCCAKEVGCRKDWGPYIEGAAVDRAGNFYAVDFKRGRSNIGKIDGNDGTCSPTPAASTKDHPTITALNGLRVLPDGSMLATAPEQKQIVVIEKGHTKDFCSDPRMVAPNDIAISPKTGYVYISGQSWTADTKVGDGDVWLCKKAGAAPMRLAQLGRTNGIEVSADGAYLFVSEAFNKAWSVVSNVIWRYPINPDGTLRSSDRAPAYDFGKAEGTGNIDVDGMRLDASGLLYVTRNGGGEVVVINPIMTNKSVRRLPLPFGSPSNLEFGGPQGRTLFVVGRCGFGTPFGAGDGCVEAIGVDKPGLYWQNLQKGLPAVQK